MVSYDASVIQRFADALYAQARFMVIKCAVAFGVVGFVGGYALAVYAGAKDGASVVGGVVGLLAVLMGAGYGQTRAFAVRLQAQQALCHVETERNTRAAAAVRAA